MEARARSSSAGREREEEKEMSGGDKDKDGGEDDKNEDLDIFFVGIIFAGRLHKVKVMLAKIIFFQADHLRGLNWSA